MTKATTRETVKLLIKSILTRLENQKSIQYPPRLRQIVADEVVGLIGPYVMTDQDIREKAIVKLGQSVEALANSQFTETEQFRAAKAVVRGQMGDDELNGFFFQRPMKHVAKSIAEYLMRSSHIDDVFETDEDLEQMIVDVIKRFDANQLH
jgi:hypothetical protein